MTSVSFSKLPTYQVLLSRIPESRNLDYRELWIRASWHTGRIELLLYLAQIWVVVSSQIGGGMIVDRR
ncbi:uncharacterized protein C8R40DRAFT_1105820 [Lentinula edodes]|uniref:uncharacterized protein n=1 Tax=Lentinula edodes TaxID=5353 RepID=UPI001E8DA6BB|nr:uncharacterized protein C8R40DRAFT_1105820 [Lentinula edodes]KAH7874830.1 hypothetical protein C8R40DRAFT_1105820 [Lentinula edodes]